MSASSTSATAQCRRVDNSSHPENYVSIIKLWNTENYKRQCKVKVHLLDLQDHQQVRFEQDLPKEQGTTSSEKISLALDCSTGRKCSHRLVMKAIELAIPDPAFKLRKRTARPTLSTTAHSISVTNYRQPSRAHRSRPVRSKSASSGSKTSSDSDGPAPRPNHHTQLTSRSTHEQAASNQEVCQ